MILAWLFFLCVHRLLKSLIFSQSILGRERFDNVHNTQIDILEHGETDSNYSVIFSFWDRIHKTVKLDVPQSEITIGVPQYSDADELTIGKLLILPFSKIKKWKDTAQIRTK